MENTPFHNRKHPFLQQHLNTQSQTNSHNTNKSCSSFLIKFLLIALFLSVLPLFPSEPPDSISDTIFGPTWELFRLLVIGILLSYGFFCCQRFPRISSITRVSQPYVADVAHHSAAVDCEGSIPRQRYKFGEYRSEPYVFVGRNSCKNFDERPLGLPVRSLRSRVVDSESDSDSHDGGGEECGSESESDVGDGESSCEDSSAVSRSGEVENLQDSMQDNVGGVNGFVNMEQQHHPAWAPPLSIQQQQQYSLESRGQYPEIWGGQDVRNFIPDNSCARSCLFGGFGMPFYDFSTQWNDTTNMMGNLNFDVPTVAVPPAMMNPSSEFGLRFGQSSYENVSLGNMNNGFDKAPYFMPDLGSDLGLRPRKFIHGTVSSSQSSNRENTNMGCDKKEFFMPSVSPPSSMLPRTNDLGSMSRMYGHENVSLGQSSSMENISMPSVTIPPSMAPVVNDFTSVSRKLSPESLNLGGNSPNSENVNLYKDKTEFFMPSSAAAVKDSTSVGRKLSPESPSLGDKSPNSENVNLHSDKTEFFMPSPVAAVKDFASVSRKLSTENVSLGGKTEFFIPSSSVSASSVSGPGREFASPIKRIRSRKLSPENVSSVKSPKLENAALADAKNSAFSIPVTSDSPFESAPEKELGSLSKRTRSRRVSPVTSLKKDEQGYEKDAVGNFAEVKDSHASDFGFPLTGPTTDDFGLINNGSSLKKDEKIPILSKWDEDCFVIPPSDNNDNESSHREDDSHDVVDCSEPDMPVSPSSRVSNEEEESEQVEVEVEGEVTQSASADNSEIEDLETESDSYKPPTPSLPLQKDYAREILSRISTPSPPLQKDFAREVFYKPSAPPPPPPPLQKDSAKEISNKPSAPSPPLQKDFAREVSYKPFDPPPPPPPPQKDFVEEISNKPSAPSPPLQKDFAREAPYKPSIPPPPLQKEFARETPYKQSISPPPPLQKEFARETPYKQSISPPPPLQKDFARATPYKPSSPSPLPQCQAQRSTIASLVENALGKGLLPSDEDGEKGKALSKASHSRRFSCGSFFDRDLRKSFKDGLKEANKKNKGVQSSRAGKCGWDCFNLDMKPTSSKAALKGKSVRTIKPIEIPPETKDNKGSNLESKNDLSELKQEENGTTSKGRNEERKGENQGMVFIQIGITEKRSSGNGQKGDKQGNAGTSIIVGLNPQQNSKGKATVATISEVKEEETDGEEIDRKADEFIAKFKEQIRLQKFGSRPESSRQQHARQSSLLYS